MLQRSITYIVSAYILIFCDVTNLFTCTCSCVIQIFDLLTVDNILVRFSELGRSNSGFVTGRGCFSFVVPQTNDIPFQRQ